LRSVKALKPEKREPTIIELISKYTWDGTRFPALKDA
jgi:hypothetical protein